VLGIESSKLFFNASDDTDFTSFCTGFDDDDGSAAVNAGVDRASRRVVNSMSMSIVPFRAHRFYLSVRKLEIILKGISVVLCVGRRAQLFD
jgi:hypothetical protein